MTDLPPALPPAPACELATSRVFPFSPATLLRGFTEPAWLAQWWGPDGFTNTFHAHDARPGGHWRFIMHGPDGRDYANHCIYRHVALDRVELAHVSDPQFDLVVTLTPEGAGTRLQFLQRFTSATVRDALAPICVPANEQNLDRLGRVLAAQAVT